MSKRSELREQAMDRASHDCEFPGCDLGGKLEMAHLKGSGMGGSKYRDVLANLAMLCKRCHDVLDCRVSWEQSKHQIAALFAAYVQANQSPRASPIDTQPAMGTSSCDGASGRAPTSKPSSIESKTGEPPRQNTSTTSTESQQTTDQRTSNTSKQEPTAGCITNESTTRKRGDSTRQDSPPPKLRHSSAPTTEMYREESAGSDTRSETQAQETESYSTLNQSSTCSWPACHQCASERFTGSLIVPSDECSDRKASSHRGAADLCNLHWNVLTEPLVVGRGREVKRLLAAYLGREVCF